MDELLGILERKFGSVRETSGFYYITCPNCKRKKLYIPTVGTGERRAKCWRCPLDTTLDVLLNGVFITTAVNEGRKRSEEHPQARIFPATQYVPINQLPKDHDAIKFLEEDKLTNFDVIWENFRVAYVPYNGGVDIKYEKGSISTNECLIFPVYQQGVQVGFQSRVVPGTFSANKLGKLRYLTVVQKGGMLYNFDIAKQSPFVVVFEGIKSVFKLPFCSVATLGKTISDNQIRLLQSWKNIVFMFDDDAQDYCEKLCKKINMGGIGVKATNINLQKYGYNKPGDVEEDVIIKIVAEQFK